MNIPLLRRLSEAHGVPGQEDQIRQIVREELESLCEITTDRIGNLICLKKGTAGSGAKKLMIAAHMDEIGFIVRHIDEKGFIKLQPLGGWDPRQMASQRVLIHAQEGPLPGVLVMQTKPKHLLTPEESSRPITTDGFVVDAGLSGDEAKSKIRLGDMVTMDRKFHEMGTLLTGKAMDNRVACYVMIEAMKSAGPHEVDVYGVATVQEEVGCRGAAASGWAIEPDIVVAIDVTLAVDTPGVPDSDHVTKLGEGAAIKIMDASLICHPKVVEHFRSLALLHGIKHQMEVLPFGGTDAGVVQRMHGGIPAITLSVPTRYIHTVNETISRADLNASVELMTRYIEDAHNGQYGY